MYLSSHILLRVYTSWAMCCRSRVWTNTYRPRLTLMISRQRSEGLGYVPSANFNRCRCEFSLTGGWSVASFRGLLAAWSNSERFTGCLSRHLLQLVWFQSNVVLICFMRGHMPHTVSAPDRCSLWMVVRLIGLCLAGGRVPRLYGLLDRCGRNAIG